jgi:cell division protein FtsI/penicillin-binding protein 2
MVNQKVALGGGFQPCSTVKVSVALAGLSEKVIQSSTKYRLGGMKMDLTYALAHSNNFYFATLGEKLGFDRISYYSRLFGYGEKAGLGIAGEQPGHYPSAPPKNGGVGMLTSFGEEIQQTPLQLAALLSAVANGGTLYYLQYPRTQAEAQSMVPQVKRRLDIGNVIAEVKPGMRGAVDYGTAHRAREDGAIAGKTGTCSENHTHLGWFGSFNDIGSHKLVVVVLLTVLGVRLYLLQVVWGKYYSEIAQNQRMRLLPIPAPRGMIFDRNGKVLVDSRPIYDVILSREDVKDKDFRALVMPLADGLGLDADILRDLRRLRVVDRAGDRRPHDHHRRLAGTEGVG